MRIGVVIPDRGDRPKFLDNCLRMLRAQTLKPYIFMVISDPPANHMCDITKRYRAGYSKMSEIGMDIDVIAFIENDDWYSPKYLETMASAWDNHGRPDLFGTNYTIYYHLGVKGYFTMTHPDRSSAMNTFIKPGLNIKWPVDHEPFTDMHLWMNLKGITFKPEEIIAIGMKHGVGMCGGRNHKDRLNRFRFEDHDFRFLKGHLDNESFKFYSQIHENITDISQQRPA